MRRDISTQDLTARISEVVDAVRLRGDRYIVKRDGEPVAALVPLAIDENYERDRARLFDLIDEIHEQNRDRSPEEIEAAVKESVTEVRSARRKADEARKRA